MASNRKPLFIAIPIIVLMLAFLVYARKNMAESSGGGWGQNGERVAGVEVANIERRPLDLQRTFSGALEPASQVVVAPKVSGRIESIAVDLGDPVKRGKVVAVLDDAEFQQTVIQSEAELAVAQANLAQAKNALEISKRENQRTVDLSQQGISSAAELDLAEADLLAKEAQLKVAEAQLNRAKASLESARIRLSYTQVTADWMDDDSSRMVAERFIDDGETVSANEPLLLVVKLDPIIAVISVAERDYGRLVVGQEAKFETDAFPGEIFVGKIERIAPVFRETSRQARVELALANPQEKLKPGMFVRSTITLDHLEEATVVPEEALTLRGDSDGVFLVDESGESVKWQPVKAGIRSNGWVQLLEDSLTGRVVTLGQHLIDDGSAISIAGASVSQEPRP